MGAEENKQRARAAYQAFANGDAGGAMKDMDDSIVWTTRGDNALTGTYNGKQEIGELWGKLGGDFRTEPREYIAEGDKVVVLTSVTLEGKTIENADLLTYNDAGKLIAFDTFGDPTNANQVYGK